MTIQPNRSSFVVNCDFCSNYLEVDSTDFNDAIKEVKWKGWKTFVKDDEWINKCPVCGEG